MDKVIETISINQIPFEDVERKMGVPRSVFMQASNAEDIIAALTTLTNGRSMLTPLIDLSDYNLGYNQARFSLYERDNRFHIRVHPVTDQVEFSNELNLSEQQIELLRKGEKLLIMSDPEHLGYDVECLVQLMRDCNALVICPRYTIDIPRELGGRELSAEEREAIISGQKQTVQDKNNNSYDVELDLTSPNLFKIQVNTDRLRRSAQGQSQEQVGLGAGIGGPKQSAKPAKSKSKSAATGKQAGATQQAPSVSEGTTTGYSTTSSSGTSRGVGR